MDKLIQPEHAAQVFASFYSLPSIGESVLYAIGSLQLILILAFVAGLFKTWTYGAITLFHAASTLVSFEKYLQPLDHMLFFAAWPMLAACITLFLLRDYDSFTLGR